MFGGRASGGVRPDFAAIAKDYELPTIPVTREPGR